MSEPTYGVLAIGNALVDVLSQESDEFVNEQAKAHGMEKGAMTLVDEGRAEELYRLMGPGTEMSGGSAANTSACYASFGGTGAYIGKVASDQLGDVFHHDMKALGVHYETTPLALGAATGRCMILVTPDGQRTMNTFLGAAVELSPEDISESLIADAAVTYLEGYLFDPPLAKKAFVKAADLAHAAGRKVAMSLSDPFCVARHREDFRHFVENHVDILFCNEEEILSLYEVDNWQAIPVLLKNLCEIACVTRSAEGSLILENGIVHTISAAPVDKVIDTTGAGDAYAAGVLYGYTKGMDLIACGELGSLAASEVISHLGPRPTITLADLIPAQAA